MFALPQIPLEFLTPPLAGFFLVVIKAQRPGARVAGEVGRHRSLGRLWLSRLHSVDGRLIRETLRSDLECDPLSVNKCEDWNLSFATDSYEC